MYNEKWDNSSLYQGLILANLEFFVVERERLLSKIVGVCNKFFQFFIGDFITPE